MFLLHKNAPRGCAPDAVCIWRIKRNKAEYILNLSIYHISFSIYSDYQEKMEAYVSDTAFAFSH